MKKNTMPKVCVKKHQNDFSAGLCKMTTRNFVNKEEEAKQKEFLKKFSMV